MLSNLAKLATVGAEAYKAQMQGQSELMQAQMMQNEQMQQQYMQQQYMQQQQIAMQPQQQPQQQINVPNLNPQQPHYRSWSLN